MPFHFGPDMLECGMQALGVLLSLELQVIVFAEGESLALP
jgi:hypothetical protein